LVAENIISGLAEVIILCPQDYHRLALESVALQVPLLSQPSATWRNQSWLGQELVPAPSVGKRHNKTFEKTHHGDIFKVISTTNKTRICFCIYRASRWINIKKIRKYLKNYYSYTVPPNTNVKHAAYPSVKNPFLFTCFLN
jgi:hypothetical protein